MPRQWFVGRTQQGKETWAKMNLERQKFETYLPMCATQWGRFPRIKPFLPSYMFISLNPDSDRWLAVHSTSGMKSILTSGERPQPVPDWIIQGIRDRERDGLVVLPPKAQCRFQKGEKVRIRGNPIEALFQEVSDNRRALVFLSLLGRSHSLIVPLSKLSAASVTSAVA